MFSLLKTELNTVGRHKSGNVHSSVTIRSRSDHDTDITEMMLGCKFLSFFYKRLFSLSEMELSTKGRHKFGYVHRIVKIMSRSENDTDIAEMML